MKLSQNQGIKGFLTPNKLLASYSKPMQKHKQPTNQYLNSSNHKQPNDFILPTQNQSQQNSRYKNKFNSNNSVQLSYQSFQKLNQSDQRLNQSIEDKKSIGESYKPYNNDFKNQKDQGYQKYTSRKSKNNSQKSQSNRQNSTQKEFLNKYSNQIIPHNPQISTLQSKQLVRKLTQIQKSLQYELQQLSILIYDINSNLKQIDNQYEKIKRHILEFTSDYLDTAFQQYKRNMDWTQYQNIQRKGISLLTEINQAIIDQENQINYPYQTSKYNRFSDDRRNYSFQHQQRNKKVEGKIDKYREIVKDIGQARKKCIQHRPTIPQQRLRKLQNAIIQIGKF